VLAHDNRWFGEVRGARAVLEEVAAEIEDGQSGRRFRDARGARAVLEEVAAESEDGQSGGGS
jgi:hypothetical protein